MKPIEQYLKGVQEILNQIYQKEEKSIDKAAEIICEAIQEDKLIHVFGTGGHSIMGAMEVFYRAGGLVPINPLFPPGISVIDSHPNTERVVGYARWLHLTGWPAPPDARAQEVYLRWIIPNMFMRIISGEFSIDEAIKEAERELIEVGYKPAG